MVATKATPPEKAPKGHYTSSVDVVVRGIPGSPLVVHAFAEKAKQEIRDKHAKKARRTKEARKPDEEFEAAKLIDNQGRECVPVTALKKAIISAATAFDDLTKVGLRQAVFVYPTVDRSAMLVPIERYDGTFAVGQQREDAVTIGMGKRGLTYRPEYPEWQLRFTVEYNPRLVSAEQVNALIAQAGWGVGICEGRPEKTSALGWGRFERVED
jgi:hypothetical protein